MKPYVKPELFLEQYELNQQIAACRWDLNQANEHVCTAQYDANMDNNMHLGGLLFNNDDKKTGPCNISPEEQAGFCYFLGAESNKLMQS